MDVKFGEIVSQDMVDDGALFCSMQARGLVGWDGEVRFCEQILDSEADKYIKDKRDGELDARTLGVHMTGNK
eukprot:6379220-Heterocapsa_arctica.AAC.1